MQTDKEGRSEVGERIERRSSKEGGMRRLRKSSWSKRGVTEEGGVSDEGSSKEGVNEEWSKEQGR